MTTYELIATIVAVLALLAVGYQQWSTNQQFAVLNKGYLQADPRLDMGVDNASAVTRLSVGGREVVPGDMAVDALQPIAVMQNLGNLPFKYKVVAFDVWINDELKTPPYEKDDHIIGVLYPKQQSEFKRRDIRLNLSDKSVMFAEVLKLKIKMHLKIEYNTGNAEPMLFDRTYDYHVLGNGGHYIITDVQDRW